MWFAFIFLSLCHKEQLVIIVQTVSSVVICFHFLIFVPQRTTLRRLRISMWRLWFAFIFLSLCHKEQLWLGDKLCDASCDLLSFSYLCATKNNIFFKFSMRKYVVICFHFLIFVPQRTTKAQDIRHHTTLWFAFIFLSLCHKEQR